MLFLGYPKCSTCRKARKWLDDHDLEYEDRNIVEDNPSASEIRGWHLVSGLSIAKFFNVNGKLFREMDLRTKAKYLSNIEMFKLLGSDGMLVKRPILVDGNTVLVGFDEHQWAEKLLEGK